jgi:hypothetical protein
VELSGVSSGAPDEVQGLTVTAVSSDPSVVPHPSVDYVSPQGTGSLSLQPVAGATGRVTITVTVRDDGGTLNGGRDEFARSFAVAVGQSSEGRLEIARGEGEVLVSFESLSGRSYTVEFKEALAAPVWEVLATRPGTGRTVTVRDAVAPSSQRFYRLRVDAP